MPPLDARYDFKTAEPRLQARWAESGVYEFDPQHPGPPYTVDTPPTTVSGQIHIGHVYSYTHADIVIRYHRMLGEQVMYPFGFDDNGLPTERFTERVRRIRAQDVGRRAFIEACLELSAEIEAKFERFWKRLGLSVDWRLRYSTIDPRSRRVSQSGFLDLFEKDRVYRRNAPTLWCPECQTAVAQAELNDLPGVAAAFTTIPFALDGEGGGSIPIATTRPELLPACVAIFVHPTDTRYQALVGRLARTPLFHQPVPILADERADPAKGSGAVMCCTFGDVTDVAWWQAHTLPLRLALTPQGRLNELGGPYQGLSIPAARARILDDLQQGGLILEQRQVQHDVNVHERCGTPIEFLVAGQWFVRLLDDTQRFLDENRRIQWHPESMRVRYEIWVQGLSWDWNISRQRTYGVPFPVWYCRACDTPILAARADLPVDPQESNPPLDACPRCGASEFEPDRDVMDTWATSSVTPQICGTLLEPFGISEQEFDRRFRPMSLRPNAHDIIRTWDFYTIVRSLYWTGDIPWRHVLISGHAVDRGGQKLSKSKLKASDDPTATLERYSADAVRYWTAGGRTGADTPLSEDTLKNGSRLITKLWNAARLALPHLEGYRPPPEPPSSLNPTDHWLLGRLATTIHAATAAMDDYEYGLARSEVERFFWTDFCDNYLELAKYRLYDDARSAAPADPDQAATQEPGGESRAEHDEHAGRESGRDAVRYTLFHTLLSVLKLLAPILPHVTEELYLAGFAHLDGATSIHVARWPHVPDHWPSDDAVRLGAPILAVADAVRRWKAERQLSVGAPLATRRIEAPTEAIDTLRQSLLDLQSVTRAQAIELVANAGGDLEARVTPASD